MMHSEEDMSDATFPATLLARAAASHARVLSGEARRAARGDLQGIALRAIFYSILIIARDLYQARAAHPQVTGRGVGAGSAAARGAAVDLRHGVRHA